MRRIKWRKLETIIIAIFLMIVGGITHEINLQIGSMLMIILALFMIGEQSSTKVVFGALFAIPFVVAIVLNQIENGFELLDAILAYITAVLFGLLTVHYQQKEQLFTRQTTKKPYFIIIKIQYENINKGYQPFYKYSIPKQIRQLKIHLKNIGDGYSLETRAVSDLDIDKRSRIIENESEVYINIRLNKKIGRYNKVTLNYKNIEGVEYKQDIIFEVKRDKQEILIQNIEISEQKINQKRYMMLSD